MKNATELVFILDRSGSMGGLEDDTIGGFNAFVDKQKALDQEVHICTVLFNDQIAVLHDRLDLKAIMPLSAKDYQVGGATALLDAIGYGIEKIVAVQRSTAPELQANKVLFVIMTDGHENASSHYSSSKIKQMIEYQQEKFSWEFVFMGANIDAIETSGRYGFRADRTVNFSADKEGMEANFRNIDKMVHSFRSGKGIQDDWKKEIEQIHIKKNCKK